MLGPLTIRRATLRGFIELTATAVDCFEKTPDDVLPGANIPELQKWVRDARTVGEILQRRLDIYDDPVLDIDVRETAAAHAAFQVKEREAAVKNARQVQIDAGAPEALDLGQDGLKEYEIILDLLDNME